MGFYTIGLVCFVPDKNIIMQMPLRGIGQGAYYTLHCVFGKIGEPITPHRQIKSIVLFFLKYLVVRVLLFLRDCIKCYRLNV